MFATYWPGKLQFLLYFFPFLLRRGRSWRRNHTQRVFAATASPPKSHKLPFHFTPIILVCCLVFRLNFIEKWHLRNEVSWILRHFASYSDWLGCRHASQQQSHCENLILNFWHCLAFAAGCFWSPKLQSAVRCTSLTGPLFFEWWPKILPRLCHSIKGPWERLSWRLCVIMHFEMSLRPAEIHPETVVSSGRKDTQSWVSWV